MPVALGRRRGRRRHGCRRLGEAPRLAWACAAVGLAGAGAAAPPAGGAQPNCWTDGIIAAQCCNEIFGNVGNENCWDAGTYTFETCCGNKPYRARDCSAFVANFGFSCLTFRENWVEKCAYKMDVAPGLCNAANITRGSCPACDVLSPYLVKYIRCVREEQMSANPGGFGSDAGDGGGSSALVGGMHYPTVLRPRFPGRQFTILAGAFDSYVGSQLVTEGVWNEPEARLFRSLVPVGGVAVDAGANIGGFTLPLARHVGISGEVHAFEPFRVTFQILTANCALNGLQSCFTHHKALGSEAAQKSVRMPGLNAIGNPSKMYVADQVASEMHVHYDGQRRETVEVVPLDSIPLRALHLLKIDVESMELEVLRGAAKALERFRPAIYVEDSEADGPVQPTPVVRLLRERFRYGCRDLAAEGLMGMTSLLCTPAEGARSGG